MSKINIKTARFGEVQVDEERVIHFVEPILGFPGSMNYVILDHAENSPFKWLQSTDDEELAFVVTNPKLFGIDFEFGISDENAAQLSLQAAEDALVLTIVNIPPTDPGRMTANLLGPIVINQATCKAMQVVLNESSYNTKTRLIPDEVLEQQQSTPSTASADKGD